MKTCLMRLKQWLHFNYIKGNYHFIPILIILLFLSINANLINKIFLLSCFILLFVYIFIKHRSLFILSTVCVSVILGIYIVKIVIYNLGRESIKTHLIVEEVNKTDNYQKIIFKSGIYKYIYYNKDVKGNFKVGDIYKIDGKVIKQKGSNTPNGFDYEKYLKYQNIQGILEIDKIIYVRNIFTLSSVNSLLCTYYDNHFKYSNIIKALVIGTKNDISDELMANIQYVGISHLFVVSGLHVGILTSILEKLLNKFKASKRTSNIIITIFLVIYLIITNFLVSVIRVSLAYVLKKILKDDFTALDKMSINIILVLTINPFYIFTYSFILTYLISSMIIFISPILSNKKGLHIYIFNMIIISVASIIITLPIIIFINPKINLLSIIYNIIYIPFVSYVLLPISIIVSFMPFLEFVISFIINLFIYSINYLAKISILSLTFPVLSKVGIIIYYLLLLINIYMIEKKKWFILLTIFTFYLIWYNKQYMTLCDKITFLDVSEGDATHIQTAFSKYNIIIDTGIDSDNTIITYLQKKGIRKIDLIIISHGDNDHNGNLSELINEFNVNCVILSIYDQNTYKILEKNNYQKYRLVKRGDNFNLGDISFKVIWPKYNMNDINNNSIVFLMNYEKYQFLFTGDIEEEAESKIIDLEKKIKTDILKIAHHASNTSTKEKWLENVEFEIGVAMVGDKNTYGFPSPYTIKRLENYTVYYTNEHDTITFYKIFYKKKWKIKFQNEN